ncbi:MAG: hypothetical protein EOP87_04905 [Verrucomicrobiaceae bacterium]|nr:MAG: hypothetical protein EOP87_04905 [Verrucomicrobiaceae bacterium]
MKAPLFLLSASVLVCGHAHAEEIQRLFIPRQDQVEVLERLRKIVFPRVEFEDTKLSDGLDFLQMRDAEISYINPPKRFGIVVRDRSLADEKVSIKVRDIRMDQLLVRLAELTGSVILISRNCIEFHPGDKLDPELLRFAESPVVMAADKIILPRVEFDDTPLGEAAELVNELTDEQLKGAPHPRLVMDPSASSVPVIPSGKHENRSLADIALYIARHTGHVLTVDGANLKIMKPSRQQQLDKAE